MINMVDSDEGMENNHINGFMGDAITRPCSNLNDGLTKPQ